MRKLFPLLLGTLIVGCTNNSAKDENVDAKEDLVAKHFDAFLNPPQPADESKDAEPDLKDAAELLKRGNQSASTGELEQAVAWYSASLDAKQDAKVYFARGVAFMTMNQLESALADYDKAIQLDPKEVSSLINRGLLLHQLGKTAQGINDMTEAMKLDAKDATIPLNRGILHSSIDMKDRAMADYTKSIEINPKYADAYINRGFCRINSSRSRRHRGFRQSNRTLPRFRAPLQQSRQLAYATRQLRQGDCRSRRSDSSR